jgi:hypothetical protein
MLTINFRDALSEENLNANEKSKKAQEYPDMPRSSPELSAKAFPRRENHLHHRPACNTEVAMRDLPA